MGLTAQKLFGGVVRRPRRFAALGFLILVASSMGLLDLHKETSVDAFIPSDHPSIQARDRAEAVFGLHDPIVVALVADSGSAFTPPTLNLLARLHGQIAELPNVRVERTTSIFSESVVSGDGFGIQVDAIADGPIDGQEEADAVRRRALSVPQVVGTLVSRDASALLISVELEDQRGAETTYQAIRALVEAESSEGVQVHVAGQGAVGGYLSRYIDSDSRRMQPIVVLVILAVLYAAFRSVKALIAPLLVVVGAALGSVGIMAWLGVPYYAITSALPVVVIAVAVADAIHVLTSYYEHQIAFPQDSIEAHIVAAMADMWLPISLTSVTTIAGFLGIAWSSVMPPISYFGYFAALGAALAWLFTLFVLPAALVLLRLPLSPVFRPSERLASNRLGAALAEASAWAARRPSGFLLGLLGMLFVSIWAASTVRVDRSQVENFAEGEAIRVAHDAINEHFAGSAYLDVLIRSADPEGLLDPSRLRRVGELQRFLESLPGVNKTTAITDQIEVLHAALYGQDGAGLPPTSDAVAQTLLLYEAAGDPEDLADEIDTDYQQLIVRAYLGTDLFSDERNVVERAEAYLQQHFSNGNLEAELSGRVNVDYHWMTRLADSNLNSIATSLVLVLLTTAILFRSLLSGVVAVAPVVFAVLAVFAVMGLFGVFLEPATSMFAAIAIGVGVDFAIHLVDRLRLEMNQSGTSVLEAVKARFPAAARACFFNAIALILGFSVLFVSELPTLQRFGALVIVACGFSLLVALVLVPACFSLQRSMGDSKQSVRSMLGWPLLLALGAGVGLPPAVAEAGASDPLTGEAIATQIDLRNDGDHVRRQLRMTLTDKRGRTRVREAVAFRRTTENGRETAIFFVSPRAIRGTAFLTIDRHAGDDEQWLYLPSLGKPRRIPVSDRGDYFLGTDFTYEDIKSELKFSLDEYRFEALHRESKPEGGALYGIKAVTTQPENAKEIGYSGFSAKVDSGDWIPRRIDFLDPAGKPLKSVEVLDVEDVDGIRSPTRIGVHHSRTEHSTLFEYSEISYPASLPDALFRPGTLATALSELDR